MPSFVTYSSPDNLIRVNAAIGDSISSPYTFDIVASTEGQSSKTKQITLIVLPNAGPGLYDSYCSSDSSTDGYQFPTIMGQTNGDITDFQLSYNLVTNRIGGCLQGDYPSFTASSSLPNVVVGVFDVNNKWDRGYYL